MWDSHINLGRLVQKLGKTIREKEGKIIGKNFKQKKRHQVRFE